MRSAILPALAAILSAVTAGSVAAEIPWESSIRAAHSKAAEQGKLLLIHFERDNCVYCDKLKAGAFQSPQVSEAIAKHFVPLKVNVSENERSKELGRMFQVNRYPMDVVVTLDGQPLVHGVSPQEPERYVSMLAQAVPNNVAPNTQIASAPAAETVAAKTPQPTVQSLAPPPTTTTPAPSSAANASAGSNQRWTLPASQTPSHQLAAARSVSAPSVSTPAAKPAAKLASAASSTNNKATQTKTPELAMDGFCAVSVVDNEAWVQGKPEFGVIHLGKLYLFASSQAMETFLANPLPYTPILNEIDVVRFFEERRIVPGKREWSLQDPVHRRMFFFADEAAMNHFAESYERYVDSAIMVMNKAIKDSNPGT